MDIPAEAAIGCVAIFCGCLLCILPFGITQSIGTGMISGGVIQIWNSLAQENEDKKKKSLLL